MLISDVMEAMATAGCSAEQMATVANSLDLRSPAAKRQAAYRERRHNKSVTERNDASLSITPSPLPKKESPPTPPKEKTPSLLPFVSSNELTLPRQETELVDWFEGQWNALAKACGLGIIRAMTDKRMRAIRCRADDLVKALGFAEPRAGFTETFNRIRGSPFLRGGNGAAWRCDVDWLLTESNFLKVHEGKYAKEQRSSGPEGRAQRFL